MGVRVVTSSILQVCIIFRLNLFFFSVFPPALSNGVLKKGAPLFEFGGDSGKEKIELPNISLNDMLSSHNLLHVYSDVEFCR